MLLLLTRRKMINSEFSKGFNLAFSNIVYVILCIIIFVWFLIVYINNNHKSFERGWRQGVLDNEQGRAVVNYSDDGKIIIITKKVEDKWVIEGD